MLLTNKSLHLTALHVTFLMLTCDSLVTQTVESCVVIGLQLHLHQDVLLDGNLLLHHGPACWSIAPATD
jgi:hypothetical protein